VNPVKWPSPPTTSFYSARNVIDGSTCAARHASFLRPAHGSRIGLTLGDAHLRAKLDFSKETGSILSLMWLS
jgi:hypothetical protein